jgi:hypothetical protein
MYGELTNIITDLGGCLVAPYGIVVDLLDYAQSIQGLDINDKDVQEKLKSMLNNDQDNSDYIKLANGLIKDANATKEDFEKLGLPTDGLNFNEKKSEGGLYIENLNNFKDYLTKSGIGVKNPINDTANSGFWSNDGKNYVFVVSNAETGEGTWNPNK